MLPRVSEILGASQSNAKIKRKAISSELLACFEAEGKAFPSQIVTDDETWVHHFEPQTRRQSIGTILNLPREKKLKKYLSSGKVMITVFWDCEGVILVDAMLRQENMITVFWDCEGVILVDAMLRGETTLTPTSGH
jgi:hypothetical protein